jgi:hypothetical protein
MFAGARSKEKIPPYSPSVKPDETTAFPYFNRLK